MNRIHLALLVALVVGVVLGVTVRSADAQSGSPLVQPGGPLFPAGASGTATVAWVIEPASRTIWACTNPPAPTCAKTRLP